MRTPYLSDLAALVIAAIALAGIILLAVLERPYPEALNVIVGAAVGYFFGNVNGRRTTLKALSGSSALGDGSEP